MKIAFVLDDSLDKTDGVQQYILTLGTWFSSQGHAVHYLVSQTERTDLAHVHSVGRNVAVRFNRNRMSTPLPASKKKLRTLLEAENYDVLHVQMPYSPLLAGRIIKLAPARTAVVGTFHIIPFSGIEKMATKLLRLGVRRSLKRFDAIYSVSPPAQAFAASSFGVNSTILPNVIDIQHFQDGKKLAKYNDGKLNVVFLGRLVTRKGCLQFLQAMAYLQERQKLSNVRLLICGKGPLLPKLQDFVKTHGLTEITHFTGFIPEADKPDYLATADIAVFPSTGGESFGIVLIEAMAAGSSVVIAGNNPGYASVMTERADQLVKPNDTAVFANIMKRFLDDSSLREQAAQWQKDHVRQYDVAAVGRKLLASYQTAIAKRN